MTRAIPSISSILVTLFAAAIRYYALHHNAFDVAVWVSLTLPKLQSPLRAGLPWGDKLKWISLSTIEQTVPFIHLSGFDHIALTYLRQLRQPYEEEPHNHHLATRALACVHT